ncbi:hypothetical protein C8E05_6307 [Rhodococcus wratislaviensis]|uniref:Uncharacterized protein n=1 Tax=Rhodococcus wratislaviensis TaxID=44752 RepID=A0AB38FFI6_RHOWR|nr:hypothetical protein [Rhodococcus wratislaviensis]REE76808.1 hypothetical protein C8E05_6307 [Rhodococcus wratislaviensis]SPZ40394.1 Uncharacterised protein [Rhodococcus wratislaviensis]
MDDRPYISNSFVIAERYSHNLNANLFRIIFSQSSKEFTLNFTELQRLGDAVDDALAKYQK